MHKKWFFLPRRTSMEPYDEVLDEQRGGNILITANEDFTGVQSTSIGESRPSRNDLDKKSFKFFKKHIEI